MTRKLVPNAVTRLSLMTRLYDTSSTILFVYCETRSSDFVCDTNIQHVFYVKGLPRNNWDEHQQTERPQDNAVMHYTTLAIPITSMVHGPCSDTFCG